jgi:ActR/RegA family two-component response regulator
MVTSHARQIGVDDAYQSVLIVDDERDLLRTLGELLTLRRFNVRCAETGQAIKAARAFHPKAALVDVVVPNKVGCKLIEELRAEFPDLAIVAHSAWSSVEAETIALAAGADRFLLKPTKVDGVCEALLAGRHVEQMPR